MNARRLILLCVCPLIALLGGAPVFGLTSAVWPPSVFEVQKRLDWVPSEKPGVLCSGNYFDRPIQPKPPAGTLYLHADKAILAQNKPSRYKGHVIAVKDDTELTADYAKTELNAVGDALKQVDANENVNLRQKGILVVADSAQVNLIEHQNTAQHLVYRLVRNASEERAPDKYPLEELSAHGVAEDFANLVKDEYDLTHVTYTTCAPGEESWRLSASTMHIHNQSKRIAAHNVYLSLGHVPVLYSPYLNMTYDNTPQSGLLAPGISASSQSGFQFAQPFYWYIASDQIVTITPSYFTNRDADIGIDFNYLTWQNKGEFYFNFLPNDPTFANFRNTAASHPEYTSQPGYPALKAASSSRNYLSWQHQTAFNPYWMGGLNFNSVSDDYYFQDLSTGSNSVGGVGQFSVNQLLQQGQVTYYGAHWSFMSALQNYQTLHPVNQLFNADQYARTPQIDLNGNYPKIWRNLGYSLPLEFVNFTQPWFVTGNAIGTPKPPYTFPPVGQRFNIAPTLSLPARTLWGYVTPQLQLENTSYNLSNLPQGVNASPQVNRTLPIMSVDSGLYFDKTIEFKKESYKQTFEPRLFYLWIPTVNQDNLPLFDTAPTLFTYDTIFQTNPYNGIDRISNANQIGWGITSRLIDEQTGFNRLTANVGQIFYLNNREVSLCSNLVSPFPCSSVPPSANDDVNFSPFAGALNYAINKAISVTGNAAWNPTYSFLQNGVVTLNYKQDARHIFNIGASYQRADILNPGVGTLSSDSDINQLISSAYWPLSTRWSFVGAITYNLQQQYTLNSLAGFEYNTCCWAIRAMSTSNFIGLNQNYTPMYNYAYYLQFMLKGFTSLANQTMDISTQVPGFVDTMQNV